LIFNWPVWQFVSGRAFTVTVVSAISGKIGYACSQPHAVNVIHSLILEMRAHCHSHWLITEVNSGGDIARN
jgi:hypothetical protein